MTIFSMKCFVSCSTQCMTICLLMNLETMWLISTKCVGEYVKISGQQSSYAMIMNWSTIQIAKVVMPKTLRNSKNIRISLEGLMWNVQKTPRNNNVLGKFVEDKSAPVFQPTWSKIKSNFASGTHLFFYALSKLQPNSKELWSIHRTVGPCLIGRTQNSNDRN